MLANFLVVKMCGTTHTLDLPQFTNGFYTFRLQFFLSAPSEVLSLFGFGSILNKGKKKNQLRQNYIMVFLSQIFVSFLFIF
jgi:hypothetical protein